MEISLAPRPPSGFLTTPKPLQHAQHVFGTKGVQDGDADIRAYTERLGPIAHMRQVHGTRVVHAHTSGVYEDCDAVYTDEENLWLGVKTADCAPVLVSSPAGVAAIHAGWRGLEAGIIGLTIDTMCDHFGLTPDDLHVALGPCIHMDNYEVDGTFAARFGDRFVRPSERKGHLLLDIPAIVRHQVIKAGVLDIHYHTLNRCTYAERDTFHSYRRHCLEGKSSAFGRQVSLIRRLGSGF